MIRLHGGRGLRGSQIKTPYTWVAGRGQSVPGTYLVTFTVSTRGQPSLLLQNWFWSGDPGGRAVEPTWLIHCDFGQIISTHLRTDSSEPWDTQSIPCVPEPVQGWRQEKGDIYLEAVPLPTWSLRASSQRRVLGQQLPPRADVCCYNKVCLFEYGGQGVKQLVFQSYKVVCTVSLRIKGGFD